MGRYRVDAMQSQGLRQSRPMQSAHKAHTAHIPTVATIDKWFAVKEVSLFIRKHQT